MRVLVVSRYKKQYANHVLPFVAEQFASLCDAGCEAELFLLQGNYWKQWKALRRKIRKFKPDVIHAHYGLSCLVANLATRRVPVVSTYHGSDINEASVRRISKIAMRLSAWNVFVSKRNMALAGAVEGKKASLVPCGVSISEDQMQSRTETRKALGWKADEKKVLFAGAFDNAVKDPELAKAAVAYLNEKINIDKHNCADINIEDISKPKMNHPQSLDNDSPSIDPKSAHEQAHGQPSAQSCANALPDDSEKNELLHNSQKNTKNESSIEDRRLKIEDLELIELKGYNRRQVNTLMCACDCLLMTSKTEGSPQVIKEAMACGCPIVSVDVGDVAERTEGVSGCFVVKSREPREIAEALKKAIAFEGKTNGREKIIEYGLTNELVAKQIIETYEDIINK